MPFTYIASPHSHKNGATVHARFRLVGQYTADQIRKEKIVYSPIVHNHELAKHHSLPNGFDFWKHFDLGMLASATKLEVLMLPGWIESKGVSEEIKFAYDRIIIEYIDPEKVCKELYEHFRTELEVK